MERLGAKGNNTTYFIASGVIIAFITNEAISITENAALIGIPLPEVLLKTIDVMKKDN